MLSCLYHDPEIHSSHNSIKKNLTNCFDIPKGMEPVVNNYKINLLEHAYLTDQDADRFAAKKQLTLMGKSVMISVVRGSVGTGRRARLRI